MLMWTASAAMGESEMTETQIAFTVVVTLGQDLSDLMVHIYGEIPASETDSANAAVQLVDEVIRRADLCFSSEGTGIAAEKLAAFDQAKKDWKRQKPFTERSGSCCVRRSPQRPVKRSTSRRLLSSPMLRRFRSLKKPRRKSSQT